MPLNVATHIAGSMLYFATLEKFVAALRKVEPSSTSGNDCGNKKFREIFVAGYVTLGNFSRNLCHNKIARQVACQTLPSATAPLGS